MAVSSDLGSKNDVHPTNKKEVGYRLAQWALAQDYNEKISPSGPLPKKAIYKKEVYGLPSDMPRKGSLFLKTIILRVFL